MVLDGVLEVLKHGLTRSPGARQQDLGSSELTRTPNLLSRSLNQAGDEHGQSLLKLRPLRRRPPEFCLVALSHRLQHVLYMNETGPSRRAPLKG